MSIKSFIVATLGLEEVYNEVMKDMKGLFKVHEATQVGIQSMLFKIGGKVEDLIRKMLLKDVMRRG